MYIHQDLLHKGSNVCELFIPSFEGVNRSFVLAYVIAAGATNNEAGIKTI